MCYNPWLVSFTERRVRACATGRRHRLGRRRRRRGSSSGDSLVLGARSLFYRVIFLSH